MFHASKAMESPITNLSRRFNLTSVEKSSATGHLPAALLTREAQCDAPATRCSAEAGGHQRRPVCKTTMRYLVVDIHRSL